MSRRILRLSSTFSQKKQFNDLDKLQYALVMTNSWLLKMAIEIVDLSINSMMIFHSYVNVYQRVIHKPEIKPFVDDSPYEP